MTNELREAAARYRDYESKVVRTVHPETGETMTQSPPRYAGMHSDETLLATYAATLLAGMPEGKDLPSVRTECRPYDSIEHDLVQRAADDALTLASMPNASAATKFFISGPDLIRVRVSIHENEKRLLIAARALTNGDQ